MRYDRVATIHAERPLWIVHHGQEVVWSVKVSKAAGINFVECVPVGWIDVLIVNSHELVSVSMIVHVVVAQSVDELVHRDAFINATGSSQGKWLPSTESTQVRPTAAVKIGRAHV